MNHLSVVRPATAERKMSISSEHKSAQQEKDEPPARYRHTPDQTQWLPLITLLIQNYLQHVHVNTVMAIHIDILIDSMNIGPTCKANARIFPLLEY